MLDTIKGLFSKIADIFKKEEVTVTQVAEPTVQKKPQEPKKEEPQTKEIKEEVVKEVKREIKKEEVAEVTNETKAHSRENKEKKFEHSPIVDKDIWE